MGSVQEIGEEEADKLEEPSNKEVEAKYPNGTGREVFNYHVCTNNPGVHGSFPVGRNSVCLGFTVGLEEIS